MLNELSRKIYNNNVEKGFYDDYSKIKDVVERSYFGSELRKAFEHTATAQRIALIQSEASEALEADRKNKSVAVCPEFDDAWKKTLFELEKSPDDYKRSFEAIVKDTVEDEIADTIIRLLDFCGYKGIDIDFHLKAKMKYNSFRPYKHGKNY